MEKITPYTGKNLAKKGIKYLTCHRKYMFKLITKTIHQIKPNSILDFGAGEGNYIQKLTQLKNTNLYAIEQDPIYIKNLKKSIPTYQNIQEIPQNLDLIYSMEVLEHIENDQDILQQFYEKLNPGGTLLLYLPASPCLFSHFDTYVGHYRRYTLKDIKEKVRQADFQIKTAQYQELLGFFVSYYNKLNYKKYSEKSFNAIALTLYDKIIFPLSYCIEKCLPIIPFGKNLILIATKPPLKH